MPHLPDIPDDEYSSYLADEFLARIRDRVATTLEPSSEPDEPQVATFTSEYARPATPAQEPAGDEHLPPFIRFMKGVQEKIGSLWSGITQRTSPEYYQDLPEWARPPDYFTPISPEQAQETVRRIGERLDERFDIPSGEDVREFITETIPAAGRALLKSAGVGAAPAAMEVPFRLAVSNILNTLEGKPPAVIPEQPTDEEREAANKVLSTIDPLGDAAQIVAEEALKAYGVPESGAQLAGLAAGILAPDPGDFIRAAGKLSRLASAAGDAARAFDVEHAAAALTRHIVDEGNTGFTYFPRAGWFAREAGIAVAPTNIAERSLPLEGATKDDIRAFISKWLEDFSPLLSSDPRLAAGGWIDPDTNSLVLDVSTIVPRREEALEIGQRASQKAAYDLAKGEDITIPPGQPPTGLVTPPESAPLQTMVDVWQESAERTERLLEAARAGERILASPASGDVEGALVGSHLEALAQAVAGQPITREPSVEELARIPGAPKNPRPFSELVELARRELEAGNGTWYQDIGDIARDLFTKAGDIARDLLNEWMALFAITSPRMPVNENAELATRAMMAVRDFQRVVGRLPNAAELQHMLNHGELVEGLEYRRLTKREYIDRLRAEYDALAQEAPSSPRLRALRKKIEEAEARRGRFPAAIDDTNAIRHTDDLPEDISPADWTGVGQPGLFRTRGSAITLDVAQNIVDMYRGGEGSGRLHSGQKTTSYYQTTLASALGDVPVWGVMDTHMIRMFGYGDAENASSSPLAARYMQAMGALVAEALGVPPGMVQSALWNASRDLFGRPVGRLTRDEALRIAAQKGMAIFDPFGRFERRLPDTITEGTAAHLRIELGPVFARLRERFLNGSLEPDPNAARARLVYRHPERGDGLRLETLDISPERTVAIAASTRARAAVIPVAREVLDRLDYDPQVQRLAWLDIPHEVRPDPLDPEGRAILIVSTPYADTAERVARNVFARAGTDTLTMVQQVPGDTPIRVLTKQTGEPWTAEEAARLRQAHPDVIFSLDGRRAVFTDTSPEAGARVGNVLYDLGLDEHVTEQTYYANVRRFGQGGAGPEVPGAMEQRPAGPTGGVYGRDVYHYPPQAGGATSGIATGITRPGGPDQFSRTPPMAPEAGAGRGGPAVVEGVPGDMGRTPGTQAGTPPTEGAEGAASDRFTVWDAYNRVIAPRGVTTGERLAILGGMAVGGGRELAVDYEDETPEEKFKRVLTWTILGGIAGGGLGEAIRFGGRLPSLDVTDTPEAIHGSQRWGRVMLQPLSPTTPKPQPWGRVMLQPLSPTTPKPQPWYITQYLRANDALGTYARLNLLAGPATHLKNLIGNIGAIAWMPVERAVAAGLEPVTQFMTKGPRENRYLGEVPALIEGYGAAFFLALARARDILLDPSEGLVKGVAKYPFRMLNAADTFFRIIAEGGEAMALSYRAARDEGYRGVAARQRALQIFAQGRPDIVERAREAGQYRTYQSTVDAAFRGIEEFLKWIPGGHVIQPFFKTPYNIIKYELERSPLGVIGVAKGVLEKETSGEIADRAARVLIGSGIAAALWQYAAAGNITGARPESESEQEKWRQEGKIPFAIKIGDLWVSYALFPGIALPLAAIAEYHRAQERPNATAAWAIVKAITRVLSEKQFMDGFVNLISTLNDPSELIERSGEFVATGLVRGLTPYSGLLSQAAQATDPYQRRQKDLTEKVLAGIPIASRTLEPEIDVYGQPVQRRTYGLGILNPIAISREQYDIVTSELDFLSRMTGETIHPVPPREGDEFYRRIRGQYLYDALYDLFMSPRYLTADTETQVKMVRSVIARASRQARRETEPERYIK